MKTLLSLIFKFRTIVTRLIKPKAMYFLAPISDKYGFDRGTPIDRFWIENFLEENKKYIKGRVLEVTDDTYSKRFGQVVKKIDVLDINPKNKKANVIGDLRNLKEIKVNTYDCIILTQVLGMIDDLSSCVKELHRITKPGGVVLITSSCMAPAHDVKNSYWRFTKSSMEYLFSSKFKTLTQTFGNALAGQAFWVGLAQEELTREQLEYNDPKYPCIVTLVAIKK